MSSEIGGSVSIIDAKTRQGVKEINIEIPGIRAEAILPIGVRITGGGKLAFVGRGPAVRVVAIDVETFEVRKSLLAGRRVGQLAFSLDEGKPFTTNGVSNDVSVIDVKRMKVVKSITVGRFPWDVVVK